MLSLRGWVSDHAKQSLLSSLLAFFAVVMFTNAALASPDPAAKPIITVTTSSLPAGAIGKPYSLQLAASGGVAPYAYAVVGLPVGLNANEKTGVISGTPKEDGTFSIIVIATDSTPSTKRGPYHSAAKTLALKVSPATVTVTTASLPNGTYDKAYTANLLASGGTAPYSYTATGLPSGLSLDTSTGHISGSPTKVGSFNVVITAIDSTPKSYGGPFKSASKTISMTVAPPTVTVTTSSLPNAKYRTSYSYTLGASGGKAPYTFTASGLPKGLLLNDKTGVISGSPTQAGTFTVTVIATDNSTSSANGGPFKSAPKTLSLTVVLPTVTVTTGLLPTGGKGYGYGALLSASGGAAPYSFTASGLPNGLRVADGNVIVGVPTKCGTSQVTITAIDHTPANDGGPFRSAPKILPLTISGCGISHGS